MTATPEPRLLYADDTLIGLLDFTDHADQVCPAFGLVYHMAGEYRWMVILPPAAFPSTSPDPLGPRLGDIFHAHMSQRDLRDLRHVRDLVDARGWLFTAAGWAVADPWAAAEGKLAQHPNRRRVQQAIYIDQATGAITSRTHFQDTGDVELDTVERPADGWDPDREGSIAATLDLVRNATLQAE